MSEDTSKIDRKGDHSVNWTGAAASKSPATKGIEKKLSKPLAKVFDLWL